MDLVVGIIVGLVALNFLVVVHELGHAIVARRNGVVVEEFAIGFPPCAWKVKVPKSFLGRNVEYSINWLPLGGFVRLKGETDSSSKKGDYGAASYWVKTKIMLAGVVMNWLTAVVILTILALFGLQQIIPNQFSVPSDTKTEIQPVKIAAVSKDSPAEKAGLKRNDEILSINSNRIETRDDLVAETRKLAGKKTLLVYSRDGDRQEVEVSLRNTTQGPLGVTASPNQRINTSTWSAPIVGVGLTIQLTFETFKGVGQLAGNFFGGLLQQLSFDEITREQGSQAVASAGDNVAGPLAIFGLIFPSAQQAGLGQVLLVMAILSIALAVVNSLPIPAMDGGRWYTMTLFRLIKKPLTEEIERKIQSAGLLIIIALFVLITIADVGKIAK
jgi:regulator of sigma E protease